MVAITSPGIRFNSPSNFFKIGSYADDENGFITNLAVLVRNSFGSFKIGTYADDENGFITASGVTMRLIAVNAGNQQVNNTPTQTWVG